MSEAGTTGVSDEQLTPLTQQARALYEGRVVPVRELARLCGVSLRTLYHHVHAQGWTRRRSSVPRDVAKSERQKERYRARRALRPSSARGLKARDPDGQAAALAAAERAAALAGAALARALARQDAEAAARMLSIMTRTLRQGRAVGSARPKVARLKTVRPKKPKPHATTWRSYSEGEVEEMRRDLFRKITARMARDDAAIERSSPAKADHQPLIPAQAGTQGRTFGRPDAEPLDSRLRGNERSLPQRPAPQPRIRRC